MDRANIPVHCLLESAARILRRGEDTAGKAQPATGSKREQLSRLKAWADAENQRTDLSRLSLTYMDKGGEHEVFHDGKASVLKLNNFEYAGDDLSNFFFRIAAHNRFFANIPYTLIGFAENSRHEFCAVLMQPYIKASREATPSEIISHMQALGFQSRYADEFYWEEYEIFDATPHNVLVGIDGQLYFFDTQIRQINPDKHSETTDILS